MPELPEVETIVRRLRNSTHNHPSLIGCVIQSVDITWDRTIAEPDPDTFKKQLIGRQILDVGRRAKFLHFPLSQGHLIAHLRMSGDMRVEPRQTNEGQPNPQEPYDRVLINFESNWRLVFSTIRKFGRMWYLEDAQSLFGNLGPEPLSEDFSPQLLYEKLQAHNRQIKPLLMDQHFIAGLGNIYADESLFQAKIHPLRQSNTLSLSEAHGLFDAIQTTLKEGIQSFGASLDWVYRGGQFQNYFKVYQRMGEPCPICGTPIKKITVGQRGTHFCPNCQKAPEID